ncbi:MAG: hypothetical protein HFI76_04250 [Lachnospiraceae bacterium]|jgi:hypothetical protein|nr:hypothetical protein [Lachnospiraceae bacterium]
MKKEIICNCCGAQIKRTEEFFIQDYLHIIKEWGYFSEKDGKRQEFYLCEACYDRITGEFLHPVTTVEVTELV